MGNFSPLSWLEDCAIVHAALKRFQTNNTKHTGRNIVKMHENFAIFETTKNFFSLLQWIFANTVSCFFQVKIQIKTSRLACINCGEPNVS